MPDINMTTENRMARRRHREMEMLWQVEEREYHKMLRRAEEARNRDYRLTKKERRTKRHNDNRVFKARMRFCNVVYGGSLRDLSITGTLLHWAKTHLLAGEMELAREKFEAAFDHYITLGGQMKLLDGLLARAEGLIDDKETDNG